MRNRPPPAPPTQAPGLVVATHGRHVVVEDALGARRICHAKGKKNLAVVGDRVHWTASADEGVVDAVLPRSNLFYRQDDVRTKSFAANIDQLLIVLAADPEFSERQLARALIAAEAAGIAPLIVLNKADLQARFATSWERLAPYRDMGYQVMKLCLNAAELTAQPQILGELSTLVAQMAQRRTLVLGPSGVGKSTLVNRLVPTAHALTNEVSKALNSGKHTTTSTLWYWTDATKTTAVIDSPGFQEFGLHHIKPAQLAALMPDFRTHLGHCKYHNCTHLHEPGCGIISAVENATIASKINKHRYHIYKDLHAELSAIKAW